MSWGPEEPNDGHVCEEFHRVTLGEERHPDAVDECNGCCAQFDAEGECVAEPEDA